MIPVVVDCSVLLAAIGWWGSARRCLLLAAHRRIRLCVTEFILGEYEAVIPERLQQEVPEVDPKPRLAWVRAKSTMFEPVPLGRRRGRDPKDDPYLAAALAAKAHYIITYDRDLLVLGKPFGVEIITPAELIRRLADH